MHLHLDWDLAAVPVVVPIYIRLDGPELGVLLQLLPLPSSPVVVVVVVHKRVVRRTVVAEIAVGGKKVIVVVVAGAKKIAVAVELISDAEAVAVVVA